MQSNKGIVLHSVNLKKNRFRFATSILGCLLQINEIHELATINKAIIRRSVLIYFHLQQSRCRAAQTLHVLRCCVLVGHEIQESGFNYDIR